MSMFKGKVPHTFVLLFGLMVLAVIGTYVLPAGQFDRIQGRTDPQDHRGPRLLPHGGQHPGELL